MHAWPNSLELRVNLRLVLFAVVGSSNYHTLLTSFFPFTSAQHHEDASRSLQKSAQKIQQSSEPIITRHSYLTWFLLIKQP
ncbi:hypothetical protein HOY82DRAFT_551679 [Tuber indicum]|nr:hypothetical protein HOY82DRAFT_551679 [Tuber indicum]